MRYGLCQFLVIANIVLQAVCAGVSLADKVDARGREAISRIGWILFVISWMLRWL